MEDVRKPQSACKMFIRLWNSSDQEWDICPVNVPGQPKKGPNDKYLSVWGMKVKPDAHGNFINENYSEIEQDAIHAFASARLTIDLWEKALGHKVRWAWHSRLIRIRLGIDLYDPFASAMYKRENRAISFGNYGSDNRPTRKSFHIISHETTHAIIDGLLKQDKRRADLHQTEFIETLCDISPMLVLFSIPDLLAKALKKTNNDLSKPNFLSEFAEGFSSVPTRGLRSALVDNATEKYESNTFPSLYTVYNQLVLSQNNSSASEIFHQCLTTCRSLISSLLGKEV